MIFLRQSTASQEIPLGPFLDDTDGKTAETALSIANTDIKIWKRGGTTEASKNSGGATHIASGRYYCVLDATDTDTVGELRVAVHVAGALPVQVICCVLEEAVFDSLFASGALGYQVPIWAAAGSTVNLSGTTIKTLTDAPADSTGVGTLLARLSSSRAGYLDNLNVGGAVASQADINALNQSASRRVIITSVQQFERPESGDSDATFTIEARTYDGDGAAVNADSTPTLTATGSVTGSLAANLSSATNPATGVYRWTYTVVSSHAIEQIRFDLSATISAATFTLSHYGQVVNFVATTFTAADRTKLETLHSDWADGGRLDLILDSRASQTSVDDVPTNVEFEARTLPTASYATAATLGTPAGSSIAADIAAVKTDTGDLVTRITSTLFSGITYLSRWLGALAGKTADSSTLAEIQATTAGTGFDNTTDSLQAIRDRGDAAWVTGDTGAGSGAYTLTITVNDGTTALQNATVRLTEGVTVLTATTNASGQAVFSVDAATYSVAITKDGYSFTPTTKVVAGTGSQTYSMSAVVVTPPADPDKSTVLITCYGTDTEVEEGVELVVQQTGPVASDTGHAFDGTAYTATSDVSGEITLTLWRNAPYRIRRSGSRRWTTFTPNAGVFSLSSFAGADE